MKIIAFAGLAQSGKTTVANLLAAELFQKDYTVRLDHFAKPLKQAANMVGANKTAQPELYRLFCQYVGRNFRDPSFVDGVTGENYWVDKMHTRLLDHQMDESRRLSESEEDGLLWYESAVIIDDVRYPNEVDLVRKWGGTIVFVDAAKRMGLPNEKEQWPVWRQDPSELLAYNYMQGNADEGLIDCNLVNNRDLDSLQRAVIAMSSLWAQELAGEENG